MVIKADGLASGKGVTDLRDEARGQEAITGLFSGKLLGTAETSVVIEEFLGGEELSFLLLSDGKHVAPWFPHRIISGSAKEIPDRTRAAWASIRPITCSMRQMREWIVHHVAQPTIDGMAAEDTPFVGVLYCGLMMTARGPMVLEYNARFGDPETQAILVRLESDLVDALEACVEGRLERNGASLEAGRFGVCYCRVGGISGQLYDREPDHRPR